MLLALLMVHLEDPEMIAHSLSVRMPVLSASSTLAAIVPLSVADLAFDETRL
jgi:hypothetical protein